MSIRTIIEINHDHLHKLEDPEVWSHIVGELQGSGVTGELNRRGVAWLPGDIKVLAQRHHSEALTLKLGDRVAGSALTTIQKLSALRRVADEAADAAYREAGCRSDAVNWGDFCCVAAEAYVDEDGTHGLRVRFEEAAPDCPNIHAFISEYLTRHGWESVEILTEW